MLIIALVAFIVLGGGGAFAFYMMRAPAQSVDGDSHGDSHEKKKKKKKKESEHGLVSLEPFVVNLADQGGSRFLRLSLRLVVDTPEEAEKVQKNDVLLVRVRSAILELLTQQTADQLVTTEGKATLKTAIAEHLKTLLEDTEVTDVLFSDFVVQF